MSDTSPIVVVVTKPDPGASLGLRMISRDGKLTVASLEKPEILNSDLKVGMRIESINGTKVSGVDTKDAVAIIKSAPTTVTIVAYTIAKSTTTFESLVKEEFAREFNILWKPNKLSCVIDHKQNPDACTACLCPGCVQVYSYTLTIDMSSGIPKLSYKDNIAGSFNRIQGNMTAGAGNTMTVNGVGRMNDSVVQRCNRIENRLVMEQNNNALGAGVPISEVMEERVGIADEIGKLKKLHDDGVLDKEEFEQAKSKVLSS
eukprot:CAMPEP_0194419980 /NCGR_PEP_ID=MMETSP0176-20130528/19201_1 /TAXON_ID=216777 /ORGANISM="Proboscia alata, Strain PI-D3" /LENGTH=258 /DNA_ID=CAMNT_0039227281 /DNA_START=96 /DNA_END=872 /DNA_ORIENTATION=+